MNLHVDLSGPAWRNGIWRDRIMSEIASIRRATTCIPASTPTHKTTGYPDIRFTYDDRALAAALDDEGVVAVVHHTPQGSITPGTHIDLLDEHLNLFVARSRAPLALADATAVAILRGEITDWSQLGSRSGKIEVLAHGDPVHLDALMCLLHLRRSDLRPDVEFHDSYGELASASDGRDDVILFGLRPSHAVGRRIRPVAVNGIHPWEFDRRSLVPWQRISLVWPSSFEWRKDRMATILDYLGTVRQRVAEDARAVSTFKEMLRQLPVIQRSAA